MDSVLPLQLDQIYDEGEAPKTSRPRAPVFDAGRLVSPQGLPRLRSKLMATKLRGHTRKDLGKVLGVYEIWSHRLWPKSNQRDLLQLIAKAGSTPEVKAWRREVLNEEKYGVIEGERVEDERGDGERGEGERVEGERVEGERVEGERVEEIEIEQPDRPAQIDSDSDSDILLDEPKLQPNEPNEPNMPNEPSPSPPEVDEQWEIYAQLGF